LSELDQFLIVFAVFSALTAVALFTSRGYRDAYLDWLTFKDPFGTRLWREFPIRHSGPLLTAVLLAMVLLTYFPARDM